MKQHVHIIIDKCKCNCNFYVVYEKLQRKTKHALYGQHSALWDDIALSKISAQEMEKPKN
jgi:hypothetical protein